MFLDTVHLFLLEAAVFLVADNSYGNENHFITTAMYSICYNGGLEKSPHNFQDSGTRISMIFFFFGLHFFLHNITL